MWAKDKKKKKGKKHGHNVAARNGTNGRVSSVPRRGSSGSCVAVTLSGVMWAHLAGEKGNRLEGWGGKKGNLLFQRESVRRNEAWFFCCPKCKQSLNGWGQWCGSQGGKLCEWSWGRGEVGVGGRGVGGGVWVKMLPDWAAVWSVGTSGNQSGRVTQASSAGGMQTNRTTNWRGRLFQIEDGAFLPTPLLMLIKQNPKNRKKRQDETYLSGHVPAGAGLCRGRRTSPAPPGRRPEVQAVGRRSCLCRRSAARHKKVSVASRLECLRVYLHCANLGDTSTTQSKQGNCEDLARIP